jgi:tetratricopeptide (TPR) repeat protein
LLKAFISAMARRLLLASFAIILLSTMAVPAVTSHWHMVTTSDFYILTNATEGKTRQAAIRLEQMHIIFGQLLSRNKIVTSEPLDVMVLRDEDYVNAAPARTEGAAREGGFFIPGDDRNFIVLNADQPDGWRAISRQYAGMLLNYNYPPAQPWFDEGFVQYFSSLKIGEKEGAIGGDPDGSFVAALNSSDWIPIADLFSQKIVSGCNADMREKLFCAESWIVMHYLVNNGRLSDVGPYFNAVVVHKTPVNAAIEQAFGVNAQQLQKSVQDYFHSHTQPRNAGSPAASLEHPIPVPLSDVGLPSTLQDVLEARAQALVAEMMIRLPERRDRAIKDINVLMNGDKTENSVEHRALAWLYIQQNNYSQALEELKDASELKNNDAWVLYYSSIIRYRQAQAKGKSYQGLENMFQEMRAVIEWNDQFAEAYDMLAMARLDGGGINSAIDAIRSAVQLAPRNQRYILHFAEIYMAAKKWDAATSLLEKLKAGDDPALASAASQDLHDLPYLKKYGILPQDAAEAEQHAVYSQDSDEDDSPDAPAVPQIPMIDTRPVKFAKGTLLSVDCSKAPLATLKVLVAGKKLDLLTEDFKSLVVVGASEPSCEWHDVHVAINYKASKDGQGDLVSLELQ